MNIMFDYMKGTVAFIQERSITLETNGIGYLIQTPSTKDFKIDESITLFTHFHLRENAIDVFGFASKKERDFFLSLLSVKGLGPKSALSLLGSEALEEVIDAINSANAGYLQRFPGIGPKASQQIILDLRGKINLLQTQEKLSLEILQTIDALKNLGYKQTEIKRIIPILEKEQHAQVSDLIKLALKNI